MPARSLLATVRGFLSGLFGLVLFLVVGGVVIFLLFRGCEGNHRYMNVGGSGAAAADGQRGT